ncbi:Outer membrane protein assembly factor YaeT precursor [Minicystis rosea]|nr:Outer membrane protein assembly factor YaeT precursor [Minicystis rosea]
MIPRVSLLAAALALAGCALRVAPAPTATPATGARRDAACAAKDDMVHASFTNAPTTYLKDGVPIDEVVVHGARTVPASTILEVMKSRAGGAFDELTAEQDLLRIEALSTFEDVRIAWERRAKGIVLIIEVDERPLIGEVFLAPGSSTPEAGQWVPPLAGDLYDPAMVTRALRALERSWIGRGHVDAQASVRARRTDAEHVDLCVTLAPGPLWTVARVAWPGAHRLSTDDLHAAMDTKSDAFNVAGKPFRPDLLGEDRQRLQVLLGNRGFLDGSVKGPKITRIAEQSAVIIEMPVTEGPEYRIGRLDFQGRLAGPRAEYAKQLGLSPGEVLSRKKMWSGIERLRKHHRALSHEDTQLSPKLEMHPERGLVDVVIQVKGS